MYNDICPSCESQVEFEEGPTTCDNCGAELMCVVGDIHSPDNIVLIKENI